MKEGEESSGGGSGGALYRSIKHRRTKDQGRFYSCPY